MLSCLSSDSCPWFGTLSCIFVSNWERMLSENFARNAYKTAFFIGKWWTSLIFQKQETICKHMLTKHLLQLDPCLCNNVLQQGTLTLHMYAESMEKPKGQVDETYLKSEWCPTCDICFVYNLLCPRVKLYLESDKGRERMTRPKHMG